MDLHDYADVAQNYDEYVETLRVAGMEEYIAFHLELAAQYGGRGVLDIGCGTGALLVELLKQGHRATGVDISEAMVQVARRKLENLDAGQRARAALVCACMSTFFTSGEYSLAVIARSGFMHLLTPEDQERALRNIHRHLTADGILSFNTFDPNYAIIAGRLKGSNPQPAARTEYTNTRGNRERIWNAGEYDPETQLIEGLWTFEELNAQGEVIDRRERPARMRWSFEPETRHLLRLCGFEVIAQYSDYAKAPRRYGGHIMWVVRKTG